MNDREDLLERVPSWQRYAAWGAFLSTVPSALWRVFMIIGVLPGTEDLRRFELADDPQLGYVYVFSLSVVQLAAGFLAVGLVRAWGERVFGRDVPVTPVVVAGLIGGLAVVYLFDISMVSQLLAGHRPDAGLVAGLPLTVMIACYIPILFWGPLVVITTAGYWARRRRPGEQRLRTSPPPLYQRPR